VIALSVLRSPPCSGAFIAVVAHCHWNPLSPLSEILPLPAAEVARVVKSSILDRSS
jgi:hypothetical protein